MVETGPGIVKIQNPPGAHDDIVTAVGVLVADLAAKPDVRRGRIAVPQGMTVSLSYSSRTPNLPLPPQLKLTQRAAPAGLRVILLPGSTSDLSRVRGSCGDQWSVNSSSLGHACVAGVQSEFGI